MCPLLEKRLAQTQKHRLPSFFFPISLYDYFVNFSDFKYRCHEVLAKRQIFIFFYIVDNPKNKSYK